MKKIVISLVIILIAVSSVIFVTNDEQREWIFKNKTKLKYSGFYVGFNDLKNGVAVGYHGAVSYTNDSGKTWNKGVNESNCRFGLEILDASTIWSVGNYGANRISYDGGKTWSAVSDFPLKDEFPNNLVSVIDKSNIWIASSVKLGFSKDGGNTWKDVSLPNGLKEIRGMDFVTDLKGRLISDEGLIYTTNDGGQSWKSKKIKEMETLPKLSEAPSVAMRFIDNKNGLIVYIDTKNKNHSLITTNGGRTWKEVKLGDLHHCKPYISRDGKYLTLLNDMREASIYELK